MNRTIVVTGGTGYIGSHTTVELMDKGHDVIIIDNLCNSSIEVLSSIEKITNKKPAFEKIDLCEKDRVFNVFMKYPKIEAIIHFAALKAVGESVDMPLEYYHNNIESLLNLLYAMREFDVQNFIFSSSCTVYGQPDMLPVTETSPIQKANSPYGNTKQISEEIIFDFLQTQQTKKAISLRYFNPIGAHKSAFIGELPIGIPLNLIPFIMQTAIGKRKELHVFGDDYNTPDGSCIRDYIDVMDLAKAHVVSLERILKNENSSPYEVFNLGTGKGVSVYEIIQAFEKATGQKLNYKVTSRRTGDIEQIWADVSKANKELKWKAETPLEQTLLSAWNWERYINNAQTD